MVIDNTLTFTIGLRFFIQYSLYMFVNRGIFDFWIRESLQSANNFPYHDRIVTNEDSTPSHPFSASFPTSAGKSGYGVNLQLSRTKIRHPILSPTSFLPHVRCHLLAQQVRVWHPSFSFVFYPEKVKVLILFRISRR